MHMQQPRTAHKSVLGNGSLYADCSGWERMCLGEEEYLTFVFINLHLLFIIHSLIRKVVASHSETGEIPGNLDTKINCK